MEIECCGVAYIVEDPKATCAFCNKVLKPKKEKQVSSGRRLSGAQRLQLKKAGLQLPRGCEQPQDSPDYMRYLMQESEKFRTLQLKESHGNMPIVCPVCGQTKPFRTFNWIRGKSKKFDLLSDEYDEDFVLVYGEAVRDSRVICGQCVVNYANGNLPRTHVEQRKANNQNKLNYYYRNRRILIIPEGGKCPKCKQQRSLHPNAWAKSPDGPVCRACAGRAKSLPP